VSRILQLLLPKLYYCFSPKIVRFQNGSNKVAIELRVVQFWSEIMLVISNRTRATRSFDFEITQTTLHSTQFNYHYLLCHPIRLKLASLFHIQSGVKSKPIRIHSDAFSRPLRQPHVITSRFDWFIGLPVSFVIGLSDHFCFGFTTLNRKPL